MLFFYYMIINVSSRCDIPAFYSKWFYNRIKEGFVDVRNPFYPNQISRIFLNPNTVDAIIFCTKNPIPMISELDLLEPYPYLFQITVTPYGKDIEPSIPSKTEILKSIQTISKKIGRERVILRYDPILITKKYTIQYHIELFAKICTFLRNDIETIIISFIDLKKNTLKHRNEMDLKIPTLEQIQILANEFGQISKRYNLKIQTCAEEYDLTKYGFSKNSCINYMLMYHLTGKEKRFKTNKNRKGCHCLESVDIGYYNSCPHFCKYCYANYDEKQVIQNKNLHNPNSSLLIGELSENDVIKVRNL